MKKLHDAIVWAFSFVHGAQATPDNYTSRKLKYILTKHAIRKILKDCGYTYIQISQAEGEYTGVVPDHTTIIHSCLHASIPDDVLNNVSDVLYRYFHGEPKNKVIDQLITFVLSKGAGFNRNRMIELIDKYYIIEKRNS